MEVVKEKRKKIKRGGCGHLSIHGSDVFLFVLLVADKPPIEELHQFLEFQLPRQWAPVFSDLPLGPQRRQQTTASLQFSLMGPKLFVNTTPVKCLYLRLIFSCSH